MTASNDKLIFPGVVNGVELITNDLDIVSLMRKVVLVKRYKDEEDKVKWKNTYVGAYDDGVYFGCINYGKKLYSQNIQVK